MRQILLLLSLIILTSVSTENWAVANSDQMDSDPPVLRQIHLKALISKTEINIDPVTGPDHRVIEVCRVETYIELYDVSSPFQGIVPNTKILSCTSELQGAEVELKLVVDAHFQDTEFRHFPYSGSDSFKAFGAYLLVENNPLGTNPYHWERNQVISFDRGPTNVGLTVQPSLLLHCTGEGREQTCYPTQPEYFSATVVFEDQGE